MVSPFRNFAFYVGPNGDISFTGSRTEKLNNISTSWDGSYRRIGIDLGLLGISIFSEKGRRPGCGRRSVVVVHNVEADAMPRSQSGEQRLRGPTEHR